MKFWVFKNNDGWDLTPDPLDFTMTSNDVICEYPHTQTGHPTEKLKKKKKGRWIIGTMFVAWYSKKSKCTFPANEICQDIYSLGSFICRCSWGTWKRLILKIFSKFFSFHARPSKLQANLKSFVLSHLWVHIMLKWPNFTDISINSLPYLCTIMDFWWMFFFNKEQVLVLNLVVL